LFEQELYTVLGSVIVATSILPILRLVIARQIAPALITWAQWSTIGFVLFTSTVILSGGQDWSLLFTFINPLMVTVVLGWQSRSQRKRESSVSQLLARGGQAIKQWFHALSPRDRRLTQVTGLLLVGWVLSIGQPAAQVCFALAANTAAAWPTLLQAWETPERDHPLGWSMLALGFAISIPGIESTNPIQYMTPVYMVLFGGTLATLTVRHRWPTRLVSQTG
jgi:hypothetical protein